MRKTVLITGSAAGIGRATAELFAAHGWLVAASARDPPAWLEKWASVEGRMAPRLDVTDEAGIAAAVAAVLDRFGHIDVLVNNAGYGLYGPLEGMRRGELEAQFRTNVFGAAAVIRHVLPSMRARRSGTIVNLSSIGGRMTMPFSSAYCASKFALEGLSESLRHELSLHGIRVKLIEPGHFKTDFLGRSSRLTEHAAYAAQLANYMAWVRRSHDEAPTPEPVSEAVLRAATDGSERLRYVIRGRWLVALSRLVPDRLWRPLIAAGMSRPPPAHGSRIS